MSAKTHQQKPKVWYVAGYGHSGSTLLGMLLASDSRTVLIGEQHALKHRLQWLDARGRSSPGNDRCDCGKRLKECPFWSRVLKIGLRKIYTHRTGIIGSLRNLVSTKRNDNRLFYSSILHEAQASFPDAEIVIDTSKSVNRLINLLKDDSVDLTVFFLVRDARGVIHSMQKRGIPWPKTFFIWLWVNLSIHIISRLYARKARFVRCSYERLTTNPQAFTEEINKKVGSSVDLHRIGRNAFHQYGGSSTRKQGYQQIVSNERWRKEMPRWKRKLLAVLCYLPNRLWVYRKEVPKWQKH